MLILFVHDVEPLRPLLGSLSATRPAWRLVVHDDPADALRLAGEDSFDMVCCGWRVARSFGPDVLRRVQSVAPESMRVLLLPPTIDPGEAARQALSCAHQVLPLPRDATGFVGAAERLIAVRWLLQDAGLRRLLGGADRLPSPPRLFIALQRIIADPHAGAAEAARLVAQDAGLATRVLRTANSALFSRGAPVVDLAAAAAHLGLGVLAQVVLSCEAYARPVPGVDLEGLRRRALLCSQVAERIATDPEDARLAATAALLADCAEPVMPALDRAALRSLRLPRLWSGLPEQALVVAYLLGLWGMPHALVEAAAFCHDPGRSQRSTPGLSVAGIVHVARALVAGTPLDSAYLARAGVGAQLAGWTQLAATLAGRLDAGEPAGPRPQPTAAPRGLGRSR